MRFPLGTPGQVPQQRHALDLRTGRRAYGLLVDPRKAKVWYGVPFGVAVGASGYAVLPQLGIYEQIWTYDLETIGNDVGANLVFGTATAVAFSVLTDRDGRTRSLPASIFSPTKGVLP